MDNSNEGKILKLVSPMPPSVNDYLSTRIVYKLVKGKKIPMPMVYKKPEAVRYQEEFAEYVKKEVEKQDWIKSDNPFQKYYMDCVFYFAHTRNDSNNRYKCLCDSLTMSGCVWLDDTECQERCQAIYYDSKNPRVEITITYSPSIGVFDNQEQLDEFEDKCKSCSRYSRNCSILKSAKEGRIQEEVTSCDGCMNCTKYKETKTKNEKEK